MKMRDILFRAKSGQTWYYGGVHCEKLYHGPIGCDDYKYRWHIVTDEGDEYQVRPDTICQYTGLEDKNGTKIFEGDILQVSHDGVEIGRVCIYYKYAMYLCDIIYGDIDFDTLGMLNANYQLEVIGNVYDNPKEKE